MRFLRIATYRAELQRVAVDLGFAGECLDGSPPHFAEWRWSTLRDVQNYIRALFPMFDEAWTFSLFKSAKARRIETDARSTVLDPDWRSRFYVTYDILCEMCSVRTWGSGCDCHEAQRKAGKKVVCNRQSKRLPKASWRIKLFLEMCRAAQTQPLVEHSCFSHPLSTELELERSFAFRHAEGIATEHTKYLSEQPYSFALIETTADLHIALLEWRALAPDKRHRVSNHLFEGCSSVAHGTELNMGI